MPDICRLLPQPALVCWGLTFQDRHVTGAKERLPIERPNTCVQLARQVSKLPGSAACKMYKGIRNTFLPHSQISVMFALGKLDAKDAWEDEVRIGSNKAVFMTHMQLPDPAFVSMLHPARLNRLAIPWTRSGSVH